MTCPECQRLDQAVQAAYRQIIKAYFHSPNLPIGSAHFQDPGLLQALGRTIETAVAHERLCPEAQALSAEHALTGK